ncbi:hypothetical protein QEG73_24970 [Chitinophagaceae bacterium 26-R-25]|nr:hypothetical protein [Chitinophagaceae bacterium 26-R-25]
MKRIFLLVLPVALFACGNSTEQRKDGFSQAPATKEDSLYEEVMKGHDIGMAAIQKVHGYTAQSQHALDSIAKLPGQKQPEAYKQNVLSVQKALMNADSSMTDWMVKFNADTFANDKAKRIEYLESEKTKVNDVRQMILSSLKQADSLFKK